MKKANFIVSGAFAAICDCHHRHLDGISSQQTWSPGPGMFPIIIASLILVYP
jgi:hypothetical protein